MKLRLLCECYKCCYLLLISSGCSSIPQDFFLINRNLSNVFHILLAQPYCGHGSFLNSIICKSNEQSLINQIYQYPSLQWNYYIQRQTFESKEGNQYCNNYAICKTLSIFILCMLKSVATYIFTHYWDNVCEFDVCFPQA